MFSLNKTQTDLKTSQENLPNPIKQDSSTLLKKSGNEINTIPQIQIAEIQPFALIQEESNYNKQRIALSIKKTPPRNTKTNPQSTK